MTQADPTLKDLFAPEGAGRRLDSDRLMAQVKEELRKQNQALKWEAVQGLIADKVMEMLDIPLRGVLLSAWKKYDEVQKAAESDSGEPVYLAEHTIESKHTPRLEFLSNGVHMAEIKFPVVLQLVLEGFKLTIRDGAIKSVATGQITGKGTLAVETEVVAEKDFGTVQLPGTIDLGEGIPVK